MPGCKQWGQQQANEEVWLSKLHPMDATAVALPGPPHVITDIMDEKREDWEDFLEEQEDADDDDD